MNNDILKIYQSEISKIVLTDQAFGSPYNLKCYLNEIPITENDNGIEEFTAYTDSELPQKTSASNTKQFYEAICSVGVVSSISGNKMSIEKLQELMTDINERISKVRYINANDKIRVIATKDISDWQPGKTANNKKVYVIEWTVLYAKSL